MSHPSLRRPHPHPHARSQRGLSLLYALLALVALGFGAVALVRSVDTGALVLGNLGFKQEATAAGDQATRAALAWLGNSPPSLYQDTPDEGYYAASLNNLDVTGTQSTLTTRALINWNSDNCAYAPSGTYTGGCTITPNDTPITLGGNTARYVILRLCADRGAPDVAGNSCLKATGSASTDTTQNDALSYKRQRIPASSSSIHYRIVVRVDGARNTTSFTETIVHF